MKLHIAERKAIQVVVNQTITGINTQLILNKIDTSQHRKTAVNIISRELKKWLGRLEQEGV